MKKAFIIFFFLGITVASFSQKKLETVLKQMNKSTVPYIHVKEIANQDSIIFLDAREWNEYEVSKIAGATYVGFNNFDIETVTNLITDKKKKIVVYCSIGVRSGKVATDVRKAGYKNVYNLWGGIFEWKNEGNVVVDAADQPTDKVHTFSKKWSAYLKKGTKVY
jgi:rhodanese-related sulfurtransferase